MWEYWIVEGHVHEGWHWMEQILPMCTTGAASLRARVLLSAGALAFYLGRYEQSATFTQESLALYRAVGDRADMAVALIGLAHIAYMQGHYEQVHPFCEEALALLQALGDQWNIAHALFILASEAHALGDSSRARTLAKASLALFSTSGDRVSAIHPSMLLAQLAFDRGDYTIARSMYEHCLLTVREIDAQWYMAPCLQGLGEVVAAQGCLDWAAQLWERQKHSINHVGTGCSNCTPSLRTCRRSCTGATGRTSVCFSVGQRANDDDRASAGLSRTSLPP